MSPAVLDASTLLAGALGDAAEPAAGAARRIRPELDDRMGLAAPALAVWEVGHVVHRKHPDAFGDSGEERHGVAEAMLAGVSLDLPTARSRRATAALAARHALTYYDAAYLELAARDVRSILVTEDARLLAAARREIGDGRAFDAGGVDAALADGRL